MPDASVKGLRVMVVDDEEVVRESLTQWFREDGHEVTAASDAAEALAFLKQEHYDLAFVDIKMPGMDGLELQRRIRDAAPETTVVIITAFASVETAVQALKEGAHDYITKPFDPDHLSHVVNKIAERHVLERENRNLKERLASITMPHPILGESAAIRRIHELIGTVAPGETTVLVTGESGTGKELVARAVHATSPRGFMPLVVVNCGALPEGTLESELFGHERGAFTGAHYQHRGKFELADGGTLFLDEISEISPKIQVELLRVLEDKQVVRLGGTKPIRTDFRVVAATNKDLMKEVQEGRFREDLYYRLDVFHISIPPLRERREDIPILAKAFVERLAQSMNRPVPQISAAAMHILEENDWPGNVRELGNAIERSMVIQKGPTILPEHLPLRLTQHRVNEAVRNDAPVTLEDAERQHILRTLNEHDWNISKVARVLEVDRTTVYHKIKQFDLHRGR